jgi:excisionase family DNA binding protein
MDRYSIGEAAKKLGVSISTLRRWEKEGRLVAERTSKGHRRYRLDQLMRVESSDASKRITLGYARVSSHDQKDDLMRQKEVLQLFCAQRGWRFEIIEDLGSGMNYRKKGLIELLNRLLSGEIERLVLTNKDRLLRFGAELIFSICEIKRTEVVIINQSQEARFEEELAKDVLEIITLFSARLYGSRSKKNQRLIDGMRKAVVDAENG